MSNFRGLKKVISGGQTGADQAGLMAAFRKGVETGGTAPSNFYTDAGPNPLLSLLGLKAEGDYRGRTIKNIRDSDGTLLLSVTLNSPGSQLTRNEAARQKKPYLEFDLTSFMAEQDADARMAHGDTLFELSSAIHKWIVDNRLATLNVAGNREKHKDLLTTRTVELIVASALELLDLDGLLIRDSDF